MKFIIAIITLVFATQAYAGCRAKERPTPIPGGTISIFYKVDKNTDCILEAKSFFIDKREILVKPKHGASGINEGRMIYVPSKDYVGKDHIVTRIYYKDRFNKEVNSVINLYYRVE